MFINRTIPVGLAYDNRKSRCGYSFRNVDHTHYDGMIHDKRTYLYLTTRVVQVYFIKLTLTK